MIKSLYLCSANKKINVFTLKFKIMAEYTIKLDLSGLFDNLDDTNKQAFLLEKFGDLNINDQKNVLSNMLDTLSGSDATELMKSSFDNLNEQGQNEVMNYVNDVMLEGV